MDAAALPRITHVVQEPMQRALNGEQLTPRAGTLGKRRSGRLAGQDAISYNEAALALDVLDNPSGRAHNPLDTSGHAVARRASFAGTFAEASTRPEVYTSAHVAALGDSAAEWELFVDGYCTSTGKRVRTVCSACFSRSL
jgi:hypothetical protein